MRFDSSSPDSMAAATAQPAQTATQSAIVRAESVAVARQAVEAAGGHVVQEMRLTKAVNARVTADQLRTLRADQTILRVYANSRTERQGQSGVRNDSAADVAYGAQSSDRTW